MTYELVYARDRSHIWQVMALKEDGTLGYTDFQYTLMPSPEADDSVGFIIEHYNNNGHNSNRILCYDIRNVQGHANNAQLCYCKLAVVVPYPPLQTPTCLQVTWNMNYEEHFVALQKWRQVISPLWRVAALSEQYWNLCINQSSNQYPPANYAAYIQEVHNTNPQAPSSESIIDNLIEQMGNDAVAPTATPQSEQPVQPVQPTISQAELHAQQKEMRKAEQARQEQIANISFKTLTTTESMFEFLQSNPYIKKTSAEELLTFLQANNLPIAATIKLLTKKYEKLTNKTQEALLLKLVDYSENEYAQHPLPQKIIDIAARSKTELRKRIVEIFNTYKPKPTATAPIIPPLSLSLEAPPVLKIIKIHPLKPIDLFRKSITELNATDFNALIENGKDKNLTAEITKHLLRILSATGKEEKLKSFVENIQLPIGICTDLLANFCDELSVLSQELLIRKFITYKSIDIFTNMTVLEKSKQYNICLNDLQSTQPQLHADFYEKYRKNRKDILDYVFKILQNNESNLIEKIEPYKSIFHTANSENNPPLIIAMQNRGSDPNVIQYLIENTDGALYIHDDKRRNIFHHWAEYQFKKPAILGVLLKKYVQLLEDKVQQQAIFAQFNDTESQNFMHIAIQKSTSSENIIQMIKQIEAYSVPCLAFLLIQKDINGQNVFTLLEAKTENFDAAMKYITEIYCMLISENYDINDLFNIHGQNNIVLDLARKLPSQKAHDRLNKIIAHRIKMREDIAINNSETMSLKSLGVHDMHPFITNLLDKAYTEKSNVPIPLLKQWIKFEVKTKTCSLLNTILAFISSQPRHINEQPERFLQGLETILSPLHLEDDDKSAILNEVNMFSNNILHFAFRHYKDITISKNIFKLLINTMPENDWEKLLNQEHKRGLTPLRILSQEHRAEIMDIIAECRATASQSRPQPRLTC